MEYLQVQVTVHTAPNRADTDGDGLNDSEEVNLGWDGFATNPWKADTDGDGISDPLEAYGWFRSGSTFVANPDGFRTDPTRTDTDYDGYADSVDRWPLQDAYVHVYVNQFYLIADTAQTDSNLKAWPYAVLRDSDGGVTISKAYGDVACNPIPDTHYATCPGSLDHEYTLDVPDTTTAVSFTIEFWQDTTRFGFQNDVAASITSSGANVVTDTWTIRDDLSVMNSAGDVDSERWYWSQTIVSAGGTDYKNDLRVLVTAHGGSRSDLYLVLPDDYSGIYNVTDAAGATVARRYVGETRFVTVLVNGTDSNAKVRSVATTYLVPRSVFFDTAFYRDLQDSGKLATSPYTAVKGYENATGSANSDDLQMTFAFDGLDDGGRMAVQDALARNATSAENHVLLRWTGPDWSGVNSPYFVGLPSDVVRSVPLVAWYSTPSHPENVAAPPPLPFWVRLFTGDPTALQELLQYVRSALVTVANLFVDLGQALLNFGSWLGDLTSGDPTRVERAVKAAQKAWDQFVNGFIELFMTPVRAVLAYLDGWRDGIVQAARDLDRIARAFDGSPASVLRMGNAIEELLVAVFRPDIVLLLTVMSFGLMAAVTATIATGIGYLVVSQVVPMIVSLIVSVVMQAVAPAISEALAWLAGLVDSVEWKLVGIAVAAFGVGTAFFAHFGAPSTPLRVVRTTDPKVPDAFAIYRERSIPEVKSSGALMMAILGLSAALAALLSPPASVALFIDIIALGASLWGLTDALQDPAGVLYGKLTVALNFIATGLSAASLVGHLYKAAEGE